MTSLRKECLEHLESIGDTMKTVYVVCDERYSDYDITDTASSHPLEIPEATFARWQQVIADYNTVQNEIYKALDAAAPKKP